MCADHVELWRISGIFLNLVRRIRCAALRLTMNPRQMPDRRAQGEGSRGMRQACAQLYSLGYLRRDAVVRRAQQAANGGESRMLACKPAPHCGLRPVAAGNVATACDAADLNAPQADISDAAKAELAAPVASAPDSAPATASHAESMAVVLQVLAQACGRPVEELGQKWICVMTLPCAPVASPYRTGCGCSPGRCGQF